MDDKGPRHRSPDETDPKRPGDEAPAGTPGTGESICTVCSGTGEEGDGICSACSGTGQINQAVGGG